MQQDNSIAENLDRIKAQIRSISSREITLVAVSKFVAASRVGKAIASGHRVFGENYVQEAVRKIEELQNIGISKEEFDFHFIGSLQSKKAKEAVGVFSLIHSVDRIKLAEALANRASQQGLRQKILLQVNISRENSKSGALPEALLDLLKACLSFDSLQVQGLMTIGRVFDGPFLAEERIAEFQEMNTLLAQCQAIFPGINELSMGMSEDFELAIKHGASIIRVGTAIFGERNK